MNVGRTWRRALRIALEAARSTGSPRYLHRYNDCYWCEHRPPTPGPVAGLYGSQYTVVFPNGLYEEYDPTTGPPAWDPPTGNQQAE